MKTSNWLFWVQRRLASGYRPRSRRGAIPATTALESRLLLTTFYVDDNFAITNETGTAGLSTGDTVTFAPGEAGEVTGLTFGTNAFSSIAEAQVPAVAGDVIRVGTGTFAHSGQLNITKDITITGSGQDATILMRQGNNTGNDNRTIEVQTAGVTFEQLTLGGWQGTVSTGTGYHVWLNNADNATFDDVRFDASKPMRVAIYVGGSGNADNLTVTDSLFSGTYYRATIRGGAEGMTITGNRFEELHYAGSDAISEAYSSIYMEYAGNVSGVISGNYFAAGVVNTIVPNVNNSVHTITNWRTVGAAGLTVSHNTFDLQDGDLLSDNGFVPVAFYSDPVLAQANPITVKDNIFRGYSYTGVQPTNAPQFRPGLGQFGGALEFDGVNDFGTFNFGSNELGDQGTISLWVKMDNTGRRNQILEGPGNGGGLELQYRNNSSGQFYATPSQPGGDFVIRSGCDSVGLAGTWTNIQVIYDFAGLPGAEGGGKLRIFRDGVESNYLAGFTPTDLTWTSISSTVNGIMNLGRDPGDSTRFFDGMMDDVAWYDSVLSAAERTAVRTGGVTADARLVAHWNMDNASGVTTVAGNSGTGVTLNLGGSLQGGAIVSSAGTVASYNLFQSNDVNFNAAVTNGGNNLVGDPKFLGGGTFVQGVDDARTFYIIQADSPAAGTASDATNRGAAQTVNLAPTAVNLQNTVTTLPENTSTAGGVKLADIVVTDDALGTNELTLTGANAASFEIRGTELWLKDGVSLNFEGQTSYVVTVVVNDPNVGSSSDATVNFVLTVTDVNEAPSVQLVGTVTQLLESTLSPSPRKMADIVISDDAMGTNTLGLSGADAALFEIVGTELFLKAGTTFDFETKSAYTVNVDVYDTALSASPTGTATLNLQILDVYEPPEVDVSVGATAVPDGGGVSFGSVLAGSVVTRTFTVTNNGVGTLTLQPINITGSDFTVTSGNFTSGQTLAVNASVTFTVTMNTATQGLRTGVLTFANDDQNEGIYDINLSGAVAIAATGTNLIDDGDVGFTLTGTWSNVAGAGYGSDAKAATGTDGNKQTTWAFGGLAAGQYRIEATWLPGSDRASNAPYSFLDGIGGSVVGSIVANQRVAPSGATSAGGRPFAVLGTATVSSGVLVVQLTNLATNGLIIGDAIRIVPLAPPPSTPEIDVLDGAVSVNDGAAFDFGQVVQGASATKTFTVKNIGTADLVLQPITVTGSGFSLASANFTSGQLLAPNATVTMTVTMNTTTVGTFSGGLSFGNSDADEGPFDLTFTGKVNAAGATTFTIDDGDSGFVLAGSWNNVAGYGYSSDAKAAAGTNGNNKATWTFSGLTPGEYRLAATWLPGSDRANNAPYVIRDGVAGAVLSSPQVNQRVAPSGGTSDGGRPFSN
ncbi:MAG TPA: choice-of-anchor D domain-containing protein, partial [Planctomycetaceae bacterium]|nr:choice-of-anchor D domain-containing protein [Planctomycetaceae bacterium]